SALLYLPCYHYSPFTDLHSFPTRRSSDLPVGAISEANFTLETLYAELQEWAEENAYRQFSAEIIEGFVRQARQEQASSARQNDRSEEHTSELQSRFDLVCRLLLEKKKKKK